MSPAQFLTVTFHSRCIRHLRPHHHLRPRVFFYSCSPRPAVAIMGFVKWLLRCTPGLSVFGLLLLLESALKIVQTEWLSFFYPPFLRHIASPVVAQTIFISYSVFLHILALLFPLRLCASAWAATCEIKATHARSRKGSSTSSPIKVHGNGNSVMELELQQDLSKKSGLVTMAVVLPSYREDIEILESSLRVLASHKLARSSYDVSRLCGKDCLTWN